jgi:cytochrome P450
MRYDPLNPAINRNPYPHYDALRREEPVCWIDSMQAFAVARYDDVKAVLMNPKDYSSEKFWDALLGEYNPVPNAKWMISTDPPDHLRLRKLANKAFLPKHLLGLTDRIQNLANEILDQAEGLPVLLGPAFGRHRSRHHARRALIRRAILRRIEHFCIGQRFFSGALGLRTRVSHRLAHFFADDLGKRLA